MRPAPAPAPGGAIRTPSGGCAPARSRSAAAIRSPRSTGRSPLLKPGGRIAYVTCSVLDEENGGQIRDFLVRHPDFSVEKPDQVASALGERGYLFLKAALVSDTGLLMTPRRTGTDGFFVSILRRADDRRCHARTARA